MTVPPRVVVADGAVVIVAADDPPPSVGRIRELVVALSSSGADAVCPIQPVTDALVAIDPDGRVREHLDRSLHGCIGFPQVVSLEWWERIADGGQGDGPGGPAAGVVALGGRVSALPPTLLVDPA